MDVAKIAESIKQNSQKIQDVQSEIGKRIVGQHHLIERLLVGLLTGGHILVEGLPGLAKTSTVQALSDTLALNFHRIQFTPDLLPADVIGTQIYNPRESSFSVKRGPIFANIILADEINRAPAKVQAALLEAMQERQVTIGNETFKLEAPFLVMATQNPVEQEGTYPLPEAQVDRFMMKVVITYPSKQDERIILDRMTEGSLPELREVLRAEDIKGYKDLIQHIYVDDKVKGYILDLVFATRQPEDYKLDIRHLLEYGASPRATIALALASKALAFLKGRGYVTPQDVKNIAHDIMRHRVHITYEAEAEGKTQDDIVDLLLNEIPVP